MVTVLSVSEVLEDVASLRALAPGGSSLDLRLVLVLANKRQRLMIINI